MNVLFPAKISYDKSDDKFFVEFPDLAEAITEGNSFEEAIFNAAECLTLTIEGRLEEGIAVPKPSEKESQQKLISPSARAQAALLIKWAKQDGHHTTSELARSLNTSWPAVARLENPKHWPSLRQLEKIANILGQQIIISMEPMGVIQK